jgi:hypothetical protein
MLSAVVAKSVFGILSFGHAELVEASLPLRMGSFNEAGEMLRQAQHDVLEGF